ncbi:MAG: glycosyltransferase [Gaiellaceae bacterium]
MRLDDVVVVTVRKSFWASADAEMFSNRVYARLLYGHSTNLVNSLFVFLHGIMAIAVRRPRLVVLGSVERTVPWFIRARRAGLLGRAKLVVTNQLHLSSEQLRQVERNIVYSRTWIESQPPEVRERAVFVPLPADGDFEAAQRRAVPSRSVFTGGGAGRDFAAVIEALDETSIPLEIVTFSRATLGWDGHLPANVRVQWRMPVQSFLEHIASSLLVVVPLLDPASAFGQTTVVQALSLGKAVVATRTPGVVDYVQHGRQGFLVEANDVTGYREAILRLATDHQLRGSFERNARESARRLTYPAFGGRLREICATADVRQ